ncbi:MAG: flagellar type III secretion system pore protein FliP [Planctomycetota bacterium]
MIALVGMGGLALALQDPVSDPGGAGQLATYVSILVAMALLPFLLTMITSFAKLVIVGGIVRQALGTQQIPPTSVITGLALILTMHIMSPVAVRAWEGFQAAEGSTPERLLAIEAPITEFLHRHADPENRILFSSLRQQLNRGEDPFPPSTNDQVRRIVNVLTVDAPAFMLTELAEAFQIGFLIFLPFLVLDLVVGNVLLAMGMHMLSPVVISLPLKLLLFVLIDGWRLLLSGIVRGYT